jgi:hypothetical protein
MLVVPAEIGAPAKKVSGAAGTRAISRCWPANRERCATVSLTVGGPAIGRAKPSVWKTGRCRGTFALRAGYLMKWV